MYRPLKRLPDMTKKDENTCNNVQCNHGNELLFLTLENRRDNFNSGALKNRKLNRHHTSRLVYFHNNLKNVIAVKKNKVVSGTTLESGTNPQSGFICEAGTRKKNSAFNTISIKNPNSMLKSLMLTIYTVFK